MTRSTSHLPAAHLKTRGLLQAVTLMKYLKFIDGAVLIGVIKIDNCAPQRFAGPIRKYVSVRFEDTIFGELGPRYKMALITKVSLQLFGGASRVKDSLADRFAGSARLD